MAFAENLSIFFADFGDDGTLAGAAVRGIYTSAAQRFNEIGAVSPIFELSSSSVPSSFFQATLVIPQGTFKVIEHIPDGTGVSALTLQKA